MPPEPQAVAAQMEEVKRILTDEATPTLSSLRDNVQAVPTVVNALTGAITSLKGVLETVVAPGSVVVPGGSPEELAGLKDAYRDAYRAYRTDQSNSAKQEAATTAKDALDALTSDESAKIEAEVDAETGSPVPEVDPTLKKAALAKYKATKEARKANTDTTQDTVLDEAVATALETAKAANATDADIQAIDDEVRLPAAEPKPPEGGRRTRRSRRPRRSQISRRPRRSRRSRR